MSFFAFFYEKKGKILCQKTKIQKLFFAVLTVFITVHLFVFYNVAIEMGGMSNQVFVTSLKIVPIELIFALLIEIFIAGPLSEKLAFSMIDFKKDSQDDYYNRIYLLDYCLHVSL